MASASSTTKTKETSAITHCQKFEGHTNAIWGVIHLSGGERIMTGSADGSLRVWNLKNGKQIGDDWRDGESKVLTITLSLDGKKVVSGSEDGAVRVWDIDTGKIIAKWTGHTQAVWSVCWSQDGRQVLSGWDVRVENGETILAPIKTGHKYTWAVVYSPDMTMFATAGWDEFGDCSIKTWDSKTGELVATLKGHTSWVNCLAWTLDGKTLISGSDDNSIRMWNVKTWKQLAVLDEHTDTIYGIAISPNGRILASASGDKTARLWNLDDGQPISAPLQHADKVNCVSFSAGGKLLATGCDDNIAYTWNVAAIIKEAGLNELLSSKADKSALHANATRRPVQQRPPAYRVPQGFFDGAPPGHSHSSPQNRRSSARQGSTLLSRLFHRGPSDAHDTSPSSPLDWARNLFKRHGQSDGDIELHERRPSVVEVPYAKGKRRIVSAAEVAAAKEKQRQRQRQRQKTKPLHSKNSTAGSSRLPMPNVTQPSPQPQAADSLSTTPAIGGATAATTPTPSLLIRRAGLWSRFWLFIRCQSPESTDGHH